MPEFKLGDKVRIVGFEIEGKIVAILNRLGGTTQFGVRYVDKNGHLTEASCTDAELEHVQG